MACYVYPIICESENTPVPKSAGDQKGSIERLVNKTNQQISCCQTTINTRVWMADEGKIPYEGQQG